MTEENNTTEPAGDDTAKTLADAIAKQTAAFDKLMAQGGTTNVDESVLKAAKDILADTEKQAREAFAARDDAKKTAATADDRIAAMQAQLRASEVTAAAATAGAANPALVANLIGAKDDIATRLAELKESDPYLFGDTAATAASSSGTGGGGLDLGQNRDQGQGDPLKADKGLNDFGAEMARIAGVTK